MSLLYKKKKYGPFHFTYAYRKNVRIVKKKTEIGSQKNNLLNVTIFVIMSIYSFNNNNRKQMAFT